MKKVNLVFVLAIGFALFVCVSGVANIVNVASANSNDDVANATMLSEPNDKTANNTFPIDAANNFDDYTLTEFKECAGGNIENKDNNIILKSPLGDDWYDDVTLNISVPIIEIIYPKDGEVILEVRPTIQVKIFSPINTNIDASSITVTLKDCRDTEIAGTLYLNPTEDAL